MTEVNVIPWCTGFHFDHAHFISVTLKHDHCLNTSISRSWGCGCNHQSEKRVVPFYCCCSLEMLYTQETSLLLLSGYRALQEPKSAASQRAAAILGSFVSNWSLQLHPQYSFWLIVFQCEKYVQLCMAVFLECAAASIVYKM